MSNPGFLPTSLTVKLPNAKPVEMETWANEGEPTADVRAAAPTLAYVLLPIVASPPLFLGRRSSGTAKVIGGRLTKASCGRPAPLYLTPPLFQELRQNEIIDRLKAFTLTPEPGTVMDVSAGEGRPLSIAYSADSLSYGGVHDLPVLVSRLLGVWPEPFRT